LAAVVGIAMLTLAPQRMGGSETYARALVAALGEVGTLDYVAAVPADAADAATGVHRSVAGRTGGSRAREFLVATRGGRALADVDVAHYPLTVPLPRLPVPHALTLHDVLHRDHPRLVSRAVRAFRLVAYDRAARRSPRVIVPSEFVAARAVATLGLEPAQIRVVPHGVDHATFHPGEEEREPFLLYPARFWPHKNHRRLFEAFARVRRDYPSLELLLTGAAAAGSLPDGVRALGHVPVSELAELYRRATALVFPSLYEGFGVPVLEAMASGCPVAASERGAVGEVAGDAAVLFDPLDPRAIADAIRMAIASAAALAERGIRRAAGYTWSRSAHGHDDVYRELLG
jgi:glycosyltransferase involved in cell wall biosynthesis